MNRNAHPYPLMTPDVTPFPTSSECVQFEAQLGPWLEHDLDAPAQGFMTRHRATCAACDALATDLEGIAASAARLPSLSAPRDLWPAIEARLETAVVPLTLAASTAVPPASHATPSAAPRTISVRWFAMAATVLVAVSSGVTWQLTRSRDAASAGDRQVAEAAPVADAGVDDSTVTAMGSAASSGSATATAAESATTRTSSRLSMVANRPDMLVPEVTYEREIVALRRIVDERFAELDSSTVIELRRNLGIIDQAIVDSRRALARDPRSALVSSQLDRALQAKLELLRRVALL